MSDDVKVQLEKLTSEMKKLVRRVDGMQNDVSLLNDDRSILEDLVASVTTLKELVINNQSKTKEQVGQVKDKVEKEMAVVRYSIVEELKKKFSRKGIEPKKPFWKFWRR